MFDMIPFEKNNLSRRDELFSSLLKNFFDDNSLASMDLQGSFKVDLKETDKDYLVEAELPGVNKKDINVDIDNNYLVINAKRDESVEENKENYVRRERHYGEFKRSFYIDNVDQDKISASFENGVLKVTLPKLVKDNSNKRKIDIK
ncbi:HSP20 family protein [Clostridium moniliforme]|uniref:HSP20 family protein n=1 Tax=Clostridium moniliforme TaxID=39489 RepID=A0ABS4F262_9CLOT|nr:heat shock protein Hsp18 [Clostridium moniliforme]MBP1890362.1 HSP20 family protein [Clostridium moniliforme]